MGIGQALFLKLPVGVEALGVFLQVVHHGVAHSVGKGGLFPPQDLIGQPVPLKGPAEQILPLAVGVYLFRGVNAHDVADKVQIPKGNPGLQTVHRNAAVCPEHIVHKQLPEPLLGFPLERLRVRGEVRVLIAEQLIGDFAGQQHPDIRLLVDGLADQIHPHGGPDGGDVKGAQQGHHLLQAAEDDFPVDNDLRVVGVEVIRRLPGVFQVDGVLAHADGKGADGLVQFLCGNGADQGGIQAAGEQEAHRGVGVHALFHPGHQLFPNPGGDGVQIVPAILGDGGNVLIADEQPVAIKGADGERLDLGAQAHQVFCFAGEGDAAGVGVAVKHGADADGISGGNQPLLFGIIEHQGKLRVQMAEHIQAVFVIQREEQLAVGAGAERIALGLQFLFLPAEAVQLPVADQGVAAPGKGLHPLGGQAHNGQPSEAQIAELRFQHPMVVGAPGIGAQQIAFKLGGGDVLARITHKTTHDQNRPFL